MHELSIAQNILEIVHQYVPEEQRAKVQSVKVQVGRLSGVVAALPRGAGVAGLALRLERRGRMPRNGPSALDLALEFDGILYRARNERTR